MGAGQFIIWLPWISPLSHVSIAMHLFPTWNLARHYLVKFFPSFVPAKYWILVLIESYHSADKLYVKRSPTITVFKALLTPEMGLFTVFFLMRTGNVGLAPIAMKR